jgi:hypothetical protein
MDRFASTEEPEPECVHGTMVSKPDVHVPRSHDLLLYQKAIAVPGPTVSSVLLSTITAAIDRVPVFMEQESSGNDGSMGVVMPKLVARDGVPILER